MDSDQRGHLYQMNRISMMLCNTASWPAGAFIEQTQDKHDAM